MEIYFHLEEPRPVFNLFRCLRLPAYIRRLLGNMLISVNDELLNHLEEPIGRLNSLVFRHDLCSSLVLRQEELEKGQRLQRARLVRVFKRQQQVEGVRGVDVRRLVLQKAPLQVLDARLARDAAQEDEMGLV